MKNVNPVDIVVPIVAVVVAMLIGAILVGVAGASPVQAYTALVNGAVFHPQANGDAFVFASFGKTLLLATPLFLTGLSVAIGIRAGLFNIGGTGQVVVGMLACGIVGIHFGGLVQPAHIALELLVAALAGAAWGAIAGLLKATRGAHEVITTIMLNFVAIRMGEYLLGQGGLLEEANTQSKALTGSAGFPIFWQPLFGVNVHVGLFVALAVCFAIWFLLARTSLGYQIRAVGLSPDAAEYGGISVTRTVVLSMAISGALAGLAGAMWLLGKSAPVALSKADFGALSIGFTGIAVALLGRNTVPGVIAAALLFGGLDAGAANMQVEGGLEGNTATKLILIIQGLIIFFVGADALFRKHVVRLMGSSTGEKSSA